MSAHLYDHYKDVKVDASPARKDRGRFYLATMTMACLLAAYAYSPESATQIAQAALSKCGFDLDVTARALQSAMWLGTLYVYMRYIQASTTVERNYLYMRGVEARLREEDPFDLDGDFYSADWPGVSRLIDFLYKRASPAALCLAGVAKLVFELREPSWWLLPDGYAAASSWR